MLLVQKIISTDLDKNGNRHYAYVLYTKDEGYRNYYILGVYISAYGNYNKFPFETTNFLPDLNIKLSEMKKILKQYKNERIQFKDV